MSEHAYVCLLLIDLHFPDAGSLKAKRAELRPLRARLSRMGLSVAEVGHHDLWQRATLAATLTGGGIGRLQDDVDAVVRWLDGRHPEGVRVRRAYASADELLGLAGADDRNH